MKQYVALTIVILIFAAIVGKVASYTIETAFAKSEQTFQIRR